MTTRTLKIHSENILPIIKKWLYSDKDIFVRELVSNACDALHKMKTLQDRGEVQVEEGDFRIDIAVDKEGGKLHFIDTGIGMTLEEVDKYIAQLAFSGAEEFLEKYQSEEEKDQIIGHFGLGFYSAYMVAKKVEIHTRSYREGENPAYWVCDGSSEYDLQEGQREARGTEIILHVGEDDREFCDQGRIREILRQYCQFLPFPIYLNDERINTHEPLWLKSPADCSDKEYQDFYRYLYPFDPEPLFWIHLNVDYPFHLKGILYFPKITRDFDFNRTSVQLFCNRVFVADNCKDLIPEYLTMLKGAIDSPDIPLNVSRSYLQMDRTVRQLAGHISKKVCDRLSTLYKTERERFERSWPDIETIVKLGCMQDEKFYDRAKDFVLWKTTDGEWTTVEEYQERHGDTYGGKVFYTALDGDQGHFLELFKRKGIEVVTTSHHLLDTHLMSFLERKIANMTFQRIDGGLDDALVDKSKEKTILDAEGKTEAGRLADLFRSKLSSEGVEIEARSLASDNLPGFIMMDEQQRRMRDFLKHTAQEGQSLHGQDLAKRTFVVNTNHPVVNLLPTLERKDPKLADKVAKELFGLALLSQRELAPEDLNTLIEGTHALLGDLVEKLAKES